MKHIKTGSLAVSAYGGLLLRGSKRLNFSLKVLIKTGSFMRISTVYIAVIFLSIEVRLNMSLLAGSKT